MSKKPLLGLIAIGAILIGVLTFALLPSNDFEVVPESEIPAGVPGTVTPLPELEPSMPYTGSFL